MLSLLGLLVLFALAVLATYALKRRARLQRRDAVLGQVAGIFNGALLPGSGGAPPRAVRFDHHGYPFTLRREQRARAQVVEQCCLVETDPERYGGPPLELLGRGEQPSRLLPDGATPLALAIGEGGDTLMVVARPEDEVLLREALQERELRRVVSYALDRKGARIHLSPKAVWFECSGFPGNAELVSSTARTAAEALARLLDGFKAD